MNFCNKSEFIKSNPRDENFALSMTGNVLDLQIKYLLESLVFEICTKKSSCKIKSIYNLSVLSTLHHFNHYLKG